MDFFSSCVFGEENYYCCQLVDKLLFLPDLLITVNEGRMEKGSVNDRTDVAGHIGH